MVTIYIERFKEINDGTLGELFVEIDGSPSYHGYTLEPAGPDTTERGKDKRIPRGLYQVDWHSSPRFKKQLPRLFNKDVPANRYILIHAGNYPDHTEGCILVGRNYNNAGVFNSREALNNLIGLIRKDPKIQVIISNERLE